MPQTLGVHPVREALRARRPLDKVLIAKGAAGPRIQEIIDLCRIFLFRFASSRAMRSTAWARGFRQGVVAFGAARGFVELSEVAADAQLLIC